MLTTVSCHTMNRGCYIEKNVSYQRKWLRIEVSNRRKKEESRERQAIMTRGQQRALVSNCTPEASVRGSAHFRRLRQNLVKIITKASAAPRGIACYPFPTHIFSRRPVQISTAFPICWERINALHLPTL